VNLGELAALRGDFTTAQQQYSSALAAYRRLGYRPDEALVLRSQGLMELRRGDYNQARTLLNGALTIYRSTGPAAEHVAVLADLAALSAATGHPEAARQNVVSAAAVAGRAPEARSFRRGGTGTSRPRGGLQPEQRGRTLVSAGRAFRTAGDESGVARARAGRGYLLLMDDDYAAAAALTRPPAPRNSCRCSLGSPDSS
jgi:tetratricopeptide (TPR) repeat protein